MLFLNILIIKIIQEIRNNWQKCSEEEKSEYYENYRLDKIRYSNEIKIYEEKIAQAQNSGVINDSNSNLKINIENSSVKENSNDVNSNIKANININNSSNNKIQINFYDNNLNQENKKNLLTEFNQEIIDVETYEDLFPCDLCYVTTDNEQNYFCTLTCGHSYCKICLDKIKMKESDKWKCPECKKDFSEYKKTISYQIFLII